MGPRTPFALKSVLLEGEDSQDPGLQTLQGQGSLPALKNHQGPQGARKDVDFIYQHLWN